MDDLNASTVIDIEPKAFLHPFAALTRLWIQEHAVTYLHWRQVKRNTYWSCSGKEEEQVIKEGSIALQKNLCSYLNGNKIEDTWTLILYPALGDWSTIALSENLNLSDNIQYRQTRNPERTCVSILILIAMSPSSNTVVFKASDSLFLPHFFQRF